MPGNEETLKALCFVAAVAASMLVAGCGGGSSSPPSNVVRVPQDQATLAAAIGAAASGYTIVVAPGVYSGAANRDLNFGGKQLSIAGSGNPAAVIVDCAGAARFITFDHGEGRASAITGLTIRNCGLSFEGAIYALNASPTILGNIFETTQGVSGNIVFGFNGSPRI